MTIAKVAVAGLLYRLDRPYDYSIPKELSDSVKPGVRVTVPYSNSNRRTEGVVLALAGTSAFDKLKPITSVLDAEPVLYPEQLKLALWMRERFFCSVYDAVKAMLPSGLWYKNGKRRVSDKTVDMASLSLPAEEAFELVEQKRRRAPQQAQILKTLCSVGRASVAELREFTGASLQSVRALRDAGLITIEAEPVFRRPERFAGEPESMPELTEDQSKAYSGILAMLNEGKPAAALLFGVTGSGKTTVYIRMIDEAMRRGKSSILLVPEISLTPQMLHTFSMYFGDSIAVLHSSLSAGERYDEWKRIRQGDARVVIGTRSAVFAPCRDLGIIIIDEEQEDTYKSENAPRYHARDIAKFRCAQENGLLLLGSATPDVESRYFADIGRYGYFTLPGRFNARELPEVEIVDMKRELRRGNGSSISLRLREELEKNIESGEQSILFLNRRGANKLITCVECGYTYKCPKCSVNLTYHSYGRKLMCHYCGHTIRPDDSCPDCGGQLNYIGIGTQMLEQELSEIFPDVGVLRMDADTVAPAGSHAALLEQFRSGNIPILIGTQMVTKGLNFENVTLVGVISADQSLYAGDYRAAERTFSLITQVVGRSGRFERPGRAIIQTFTPDNQVIRQAASQDYEDFFTSELEMRLLQGTPPFTELISVTASGMDESLVLACACELRDSLCVSVKNIPDARILGPAPLSILRVNNRFRYRVTLCAPEGLGLRRMVSDIVIHFSSEKRYKTLSVYADNNPSD